MHAQAIAHFEAARNALNPFHASMTGKGLDVKITAGLALSEAWALALFFNRGGVSELRVLAQTEAEAYDMRDAAERVRQALLDAGFAPR